MKQLGISSFILLTFFFTFSNSQAQQRKQTPVPAGIIEVIQFHSEHRCVTCVLIEKLTRATLANNFSTIPFTLINVDDKRNAKRAEQFEAAGTALFLFNPKTGKKKDLTSFAFLKAGSEKMFEEELKKYILEFIKG